MAALVPVLQPQYFNRIKTISENGLAPFRICTVLNSEGRDVLWNQVYYRRGLLQQNISMKNEDPYTCTRQYIESSPNLSFCYESLSPRDLGFITNIGFHISKHHERAEVLIDNTHRTNSSKFELFCVIVKLFGMGFPLGYLFYEGTCRMRMVHGNEKIFCAPFF